RAATEHIEMSRVQREQQVEATHERAEPLREVDPATIAAAQETSEEEPEEPRKRPRGRRGGRGRGKGAKAAESQPEERSIVPVEAGSIDTPFAIGGVSFERVSDDEERAMNGEMFKDARLQERITDAVHAVEFDLEDVPSAPVGSLLSEGLRETGGFQRVADEEDATGMSAAQRTMEEAHVRDFVDEIADESSRASASFQRVSDEEEGRGQTFSEEPTPPMPAKRESPSRRKKSGVISRFFKSKKSDEEEQAENSIEASASEEVTKETVDIFPDSEASITTGRPHEELATRRGGRRRRRPPAKPPASGDANGSDNASDQDDPSEVVEEHEPIEVKAAANDDEAAETEVVDGEEQTKPAPRQRRPPAPRGGRRHTTRHDRGQPTITDLLKEGQEILVQIAKEPIAKKGARITSHIALPGRFLVYMPTVEHLGVSRKIDSDSERTRLRKLIQKIHADEGSPAGGFIVRTAGVGASEEELRADAQYLLRTWQDMRKNAEKSKAPALVHRDLDLVQRILRDQLSEDFTAIRIDSEDEYQRIVEFVNRMQPKLVKRVKLYTRDEPILEAYNVQAEIDKAIKPRVWLRSGGYLVINQTEALVSIDVNTGKFVGRGATRLEDTITRTNMEAVEEIARQIRLRDLGGIIVLDLIDMEERRNRQRVMQTLQEALRHDKSPTKVLSFNDFGLVIMTRKRVKQSLERTLCAPCQHCQGAGLVKSPQTVCYEILEQARQLSRKGEGDGARQAMLRVNPEVAKALRGSERDVLNEIEDYLGTVDIASDPLIFQEQFDFAFV
ncbi:MAG TPA: Rne/Rng family ribonuclease, partial [Pyrinomonadaceae bacterium]|nr:Rne/Rng family ribonuclease [Pyrinomonadaceae bacterium]